MHYWGYTPLEVKGRWGLLLLHFGPDDNWSIQSKHQEVISKLKLVTDNPSLYANWEAAGSSKWILPFTRATMAACAVILFQQLIGGTNCTSPCTLPCMFLETYPCLTLYPYPLPFVSRNNRVKVFVCSQTLRTVYPQKEGLLRYSTKPRNFGGNNPIRSLAMQLSCIHCASWPQVLSFTHYRPTKQL